MAAIVFELPAGGHHAMTSPMGEHPGHPATWPIADAERGGVVYGSLAAAAERFQRQDGEILVVEEAVGYTVVQY